MIVVFELDNNAATAFHRIFYCTNNTTSTCSEHLSWVTCDLLWQKRTFSKCQSSRNCWSYVKSMSRMSSRYLSSNNVRSFHSSFALSVQELQRYDNLPPSPSSTLLIRQSITGRCLRACHRFSHLRT